jgi:hypothetical protein
MDISEAVTEFHKMKRGNYAVSNSDIARLGIADSNTSTGTIASIDIQQTLICNHRQEGASQAYVRASHNRHERGSMCAEDCVQGEPIQRGLPQQVEWSTWSMAITMGQTRMVITQTNRRSTQVCATSL